jgi:hypothetical protein
MTELEPTSRGGRTLRLGLVCAGVLALGLVAYGLSVRHSAFAALQARSSNAAVVHVATTRPAPGSSGELLLPGTLEAINETNLYARVQGFVKMLHADIGQHVTQGQLLAEIDPAPYEVALQQATGGEVLFEGKDVFRQDSASMRRLRRDMQIIFQDPGGSLNPRMRVGSIVGEPLEVHGMASGDELRERVEALLER